MKTLWVILEVAVSSAFILFSIYAFGYRPKENTGPITDMEVEYMMMQKRYETLLDSTASYIYRKYGEFLPDTYWENDVYCSLYEDMECWDRNYLKY